MYPVPVLAVCSILPGAKGHDRIKLDGWETIRGTGTAPWYIIFYIIEPATRIPCILHYLKDMNLEKPYLGETVFPWYRKWCITEWYLNQKTRPQAVSGEKEHSNKPVHLEMSRPGSHAGKYRIRYIPYKKRWKSRKDHLYFSSIAKCTCHKPKPSSCWKY